MDLEGWVTPEKSPNDARSYAAARLPNGIKLLLIEDARAEKAACSVSVGVGSLRDGERSLGLAHFLEHMLFMGSRKFPRHNEYSEFMALHSGSDNAWTSDEETNYYFEIANPKFLEGVERLSDFFVEAALNEDCIAKERQAVHEECQLRCGEDNSRKWEILKQFAQGPYHNHSIGNNNTLSHPDVALDLRNFYRNEYSANRINAVLLSALPMQEMKEKAVPLLLEIADKGLGGLEYGEHFSAGQLGKLVRMKSIKDEAILEFFWVLPPLRPHRNTHPDKYLTHVLGHEGAHSLLSLLKQKEYASKIISYTHDLPRQAILGLEIQLTEEGQEHYEEVYNLVSDYCAWLRADQQVYEEIREASAVAFQFKEKSPSYSYATDLASHLHHVPIQEVLTWRSNYGAFDGQLIDGFLRHLNPFNLILVYSNSEELEHPTVQPHLGGSFEVHSLPSRVNQGVAFLPLLKNPFLPLNTVVHAPDAQPAVVSRHGNVFFSRGQEAVCKGGIRLTAHSPQTEAFLQLYASFLELLFKETTYEAETLRVEADYGDEDHLSLSLFGFSDTVTKLWAELAPRLTTAHKQEDAESLFELAREDLVQEYENFYMGEVDEIAETQLEVLLCNDAVPVEQGLKELEGYEFEGFCEAVDAFWAAARLEWVVVGNFSKDILPVLAKHEAAMGCGASPAAHRPLLCLSLEGSVREATRLQVEDIATSGCIRYHQLGRYSERLHYTLSLLVNYIKEPFFDALRTQKQLAYYLRAYPHRTRGALALAFILVSSNADPRAVSAHITQFCQDFLTAAETDLTEEKFEAIKASVRTKVLEPHNSLKDYFDFVCKEIDDQTFLWSRKERATLEANLAPITRSDLTALLSQALQKTLEIWVVAKNHQEEFDRTQEHFSNSQQIKAAAHYLPEWNNHYQP